MIHYNQQLLYQKDAKFIKVGINSIHRMHKLEHAGGYVFVHKESSGFVFAEDDIENAKDGDNILPVMVVKLRESGIQNYKQAHGLRIREFFADESVAKTWYYNYVSKVAPIVSDTDHLHGGYLLWKHFLKHTANDSSFQISVIDSATGEIIQDKINIHSIDETDLWSQHPDHQKENIVLLLQKAQPMQT